MALEDIEKELAALNIISEDELPPKEEAAPTPPKEEEKVEPKAKATNPPVPVEEDEDEEPEVNPLLDALNPPTEEEDEPPAQKEEEGHKAGEEIEEPPNLTPKAGAAWRTLRNENKELKAELEALKAAGGGGGGGEEIEAIKAELTAAKTVAEKLQKERDEYLQELQTSRVESTPEYKAAVIEPLQTLDETVGRFASKYKVAPEALIGAIREADPDKQADRIEEVTADFNSLDRTRFFNLVSTYEEIEHRRKKLAEDASLTLERIEAQRKQEEEANREVYQTALRSELSKSWEAVTQQFPVIKKIEGDDVWNKQVEKIEALARTSDPDSLDLPTRVRVMQQAVALPLVFTLLKESAAENKALRTRIAALRKATPGAGKGGSPSSAGKSSTPEDEGLGFLGGIEKHFGG